MNTTDTRRILLVEDEKAIRDAVAAYLERENYWVTAVGDGQDALDEFGKHHFDLVVLDLMLPRVPGERVGQVECQLGLAGGGGADDGDADGGRAHRGLTARAAGGAPGSGPACTRTGPSPGGGAAGCR